MLNVPRRRVMGFDFERSNFTSDRKDRAMKTSALPETDNHKVTARVASVRQFREKYRRFDYYPAQSALDAILRLQQRYPKHAMREVIDSLVLAGDKAFSVNGQR